MSFQSMSTKILNTPLTKTLNDDSVLSRIQLRSQDAICLGWNASWVEAWSKAMDILQM